MQHEYKIKNVNFSSSSFRQMAVPANTVLPKKLFSIPFVYSTKVLDGDLIVYRLSTFTRLHYFWGKILFELLNRKRGPC